MGEVVPEHLLDGLDILPGGVDNEPTGYQTTTAFGDKIYLISEYNDGSGFAFYVKIFDKLTSKWCIPTVLGKKPIPSKGHSALSLDNGRILIVKLDSLLGDSIWFLEVSTPFVKEQSKVLDTEVLAWSKGVQGDVPKPIVISGPSGVGKGTLISKLMSEFPSAFGFSVSHTTRAPREKEKDSVHYHFTDRSIMEKDIREGKFLESACVHGNLYGTSIEAVEAVSDAGKRCILDIDVQGARSVRASSLEAVFIFICPPSFEDLENRLRLRGTETEEQVQKRLRNARTELEQGKSPGLFDHILINDNLDICYENLKEILALDGSIEGPCRQSMKEVKVRKCQSIFKNEHKNHILCGVDERGMAPSTLFVLDVSMLKGGAPGQTRGICISCIDSVTDNGIGLQEL